MSPAESGKKVRAKLRLEVASEQLAALQAVRKDLTPESQVRVAMELADRLISEWEKSSE